MFWQAIKTVSTRVALPIALAILAGCPGNLNLAPGSTELRTESQTRGRYWLYVPSWHHNARRWPLVVTCHGTVPWDHAKSQLREWRELAERIGFIVAAPRLAGTDGMAIRTVKAQLASQRADERLILNIVRKTIASLNADPDHVYLVGWSGGGYAVYYTGLGNPSIFRALAVRMGTFKEKFLPDIAQRYDPYQPVAIFFASEDLLPGVTAQCRKAAAFLKDLGAKRLTLQEITGGHTRRPRVAFDFFKSTTEKYAMVRPSAVTSVGGDPLEVQFYVNVDPPARAIVWEFGDGSASTASSPRHHYDQGGEYTVTVTIVTARGARTDRQLKLELGR